MYFIYTYNLKTTTKLGFKMKSKYYKVFKGPTCPKETRNKQMHLLS